MLEQAKALGVVRRDPYPPGTCGYILLATAAPLCERRQQDGAVARLSDPFHGTAIYRATRGQGARRQDLRVCSDCGNLLQKQGWTVKSLAKRERATK